MFFANSYDRVSAPRLVIPTRSSQSSALLAKWLGVKSAARNETASRRIMLYPAALGSTTI
jgi:hypothetical protein